MKSGKNLAKAFPSDGGGMDLRDWFAGMVLPHLISMSRGGMTPDGNIMPTRVLVKESYLYADTMMKVRDEE